MQPMNYNNGNPQYRTPISVTQPTPMQPTPMQPTPMQPTQIHYPYVPNPMPMPQPYSPAPVTVPTTTQPNPPSSELMDRMRQVQLLMVEIHRLESESREGNHQRLQELKQRVAELSAMDGRMPSETDSFQPPPAYPSDVKHSIGRSEHSAAGRGY